MIDGAGWGVVCSGSGVVGAGQLVNLGRACLIYFKFILRFRNV